MTRANCDLPSAISACVEDEAKTPDMIKSPGFMVRAFVLILRRPALKSVSAALSRSDNSFYRRILLSFAAVCLILGVSTATTAFACDTGIRGSVFWGPVKPGPSRLGQNEEAPLRALFGVFQGEKKIVEFESDSRGHFEISLPPGDYTIVPDKKTPIPYAEQQKTRVTVPEGGFVDIEIRLDSGMR